MAEAACGPPPRAALRSPDARMACLPGQTLLVVDGCGNAVGIVTAEDLLLYAAEK